MKRITLCGLLGLGAAAQAQDPCTQRYEAELNRLERELAAKQPARLPPAQQQEAMRIVHEGLERAAAEADPRQAVTASTQFKAGKDVSQQQVGLGLERAAAEADRCQRAARAPAEAARRPALDACLAEVHKRGDALEARWKGRTLSAAEQAQRRAEERELLDARMACQRPPKP